VRAIHYAQGLDAWGLCKRCGLRFYLGEMVFDGYLPGTRVCRGCWEPKHPQEAAVPVTDAQSLYKPSPEDAPGTPLLSVVTVGNVHTLTWTAIEMRGGARVASYIVQRSGVTLATLPVSYWGDNVSLADLVERGNPKPGNDGIESQTLTYADTHALPSVYQVFAQLDSGRQSPSNLVLA
jgi:hypothetical protein